jgi:hypothetical protein
MPQEKPKKKRKKKVGLKRMVGPPAPQTKHEKTMAKIRKHRTKAAVDSTIAAEKKKKKRAAARRRALKGTKQV